uniref:hypothetical protein n=1 Tax=Thaumasiovibrio occultus TaxID=1891184 RepID=UPI000B35D138|nr:hypothetical protein [Thaumasiovibrio occultus]
MGWDISYHPVGENDFRDIYCAGLADPEFYKTIATQFGLDDIYTEQLKLSFDEARALGLDVEFNKVHSYSMAIVSGYLRKYHYIRGGSFSFALEHEVMFDYIADWDDYLPPEWDGVETIDSLTENYCGGVYLPHEALKRLRADYETQAEVKAVLDEIFSDGRLAIFWKAVDEAIANGMGLLEATEVVEPNPLNINQTTCMTNLHNCYPDGVILYVQAAMAQIEAIKAAQS